MGRAWLERLVVVRWLYANTKLTLDTYIQILPDTQAALVKKIEKLFWDEKETNVGQGG